MQLEKELDALKILAEHRILPLVDTDAPGQMDEFATALTAGGLPIAEVTLRRPGSLNALRILAEHQGLLIGAGTIMNAREAADAVQAGASFLVSPGLSKTVAAEADRLAVPLIPGVSTATELMAALDAGITTVKFFPAATSGGADAIRALSAVAPNVTWVPTGGITASTAVNYLKLPAVRAVGGTWMCPGSFIEQGRWPEIVELVWAAKELAS